MKCELLFYMYIQTIGITSRLYIIDSYQLSVLISYPDTAPTLCRVST